MTDAELTARLYDNIRAFKILQAEQGPLRMLSLPGVWAFALPPRGSNLFQQQVLYESPHALAEALASLEPWYRRLGVRAWRISVLPGDLATESLLARQGYHPEDIIPAMGLPLAYAPPVPPGLPLVRPDELDEVLELNALCYGPEDVEYYRAWRTAPLPSSHTHAVVLREEGRAVSGGVCFEHQGVAGIYLVATHPRARRRGLGAAVMHGLHADARARGCTAAVLQASLPGQGLYRRLGYRELGPWTNWVRRSG
jgi:GNAT superfamily N-acetyltransferase